MADIMGEIIKVALVGIFFFLMYIRGKNMDKQERDKLSSKKFDIKFKIQDLKAELNALKNDHDKFTSKYLRNITGPIIIRTEKQIAKLESEMARLSARLEQWRV